MNDLEITRKCAEAMGLTVWPKQLVAGKLAVDGRNILEGGTMCQVYDPLHNDAQAMALVKKFNINLTTCSINDDTEILWCADAHTCFHESANLNRAICECVSLLTQRSANEK